MPHAFYVEMRLSDVDFIYFILYWNMNVEDLKKSLRELQGKNKDNLRKRKGLIKEMKNLPYSYSIMLFSRRANFKKVKGLDG